jgi:hypothetical protein
MSFSNDVIRNKYASNRRGSYAADFGDDDDIREELEQLGMAELELQLELQNAMRMVEVMQGVGEDEEYNDYGGEGTLQAINSTRSSLEVIEDSPSHKKKTFATGFFEVKESLESQKRRQMVIVKSNLKSIDPRLENAVDNQQQTQETIVEKKKQMASKDKQLQSLLNTKTNTLEEEKKRQMEILKLDLQTMKPGSEFIMALQSETQRIMVENKKQELEETKKVVNMKLEELNLSKNSKERNKPKFWSAPRKRLEQMMMRKREDSIRMLNTK